MIDRSSTPTCLKCGRLVPQGAGFCPSCGTQIGDPSFAPTSASIDAAAGKPFPSGDPVTALPTAATNLGGAPHTGAPTLSPTGMVTSLDSPSPRPPVPAGDGPFQAGQQVGPRYTIIRLLGIGGMGAVYQAFDHELGVAVAIKVIRPAAQSDATAAKELETRFKRELVLARQVTHKYVVRIHDLGEIDGIKYLTMPFVEGETLAQLLRRSGTLPLARAIQVAQQIAQGLAAAHEKGVVHRDLKPENIMIESPSPLALAAQGLPESAGRGDGDALIMDFGIARSVEQGATQTAAGSVIGTLEYMAPEQAQGIKVDQRADQYAFGLIVYDMLVGRQRLAKRDNPMTELLGRLTASPPAPRTINPDIPEAVDHIVVKCLQPSPDNRYASTTELVKALERLTPDGHIRSGVHEVIVREAPARPKWQLAAAGLVIVALGGTVGWLLLKPDAPGAATSGVAREPVSVLIADFNNKTGDPVFDGVVEQALGLGIEGASFITAYPRRDALRAAAAAKLGDKLDEKTARLVAVREGVGLVLAGEVEARGSGFHITARALGSGSADGPPLHTLEADASGKAAILETVGALAGKVRTALGDTAVPKDGPAANETFTAASLEAARAYTKGQELQVAGQREEAIEQFKQTITLDPGMGRAYSGAAAQLANLGRTDEAEHFYKEALSHLDRMTDREKYRTRGGYYLFARKVPEAIKEYTALLDAFPSDRVGQENLALAHFYERNMAQALEQGRKAAAMSRSVGARSNLALYAMYAGQFETAITESDEVLKTTPTFVKAFVARGLSELGLGRPAEAVAAYGKLKGVSAAGASFAVAGLADVALYEGRTADAIALLNEGISADTAAKNVTAVAKKRVALAEAHLARGDAAAAAREAERAVSESDSVALPAALALVRAGRASAALKIADGLAAKIDADPRAYAGLVRAEVHLAQNQARLALDALREAQSLADTWLGHVLMARTYLALDQFAEATSEIDAAIKRKGEATAIGLDDWPTYRYFPPVLYFQGLAQDGLKSPAASETFQAFLAIKNNGDETVGFVAVAKKRVAR
ncbi:MAG: protein kinase [Vicinamibacterales bacterium]|jgi:tetratricopeptide (TPR) repeat protein